MWIIAGLITLVFARTFPRPGMYWATNSMSVDGLAQLFACLGMLLIWPLFLFMYALSHLLFRVHNGHWDTRRYVWSESGHVVCK